MTTTRFTPMLGITALGFLLVSCGDGSDRPRLLTADTPLHLEGHLDAATIVGSELSADAPAETEWRFDQPQDDWKPVIPWNPTVDPAEVTQLDDALGSR